VLGAACVLVLFLIFSAPALAAPNLIIDGSFEDPPNVSGYQLFGNGGLISGAWHVEGVNVAVVSQDYFPPHLLAQDGVQTMDLTGVSDSATNGIYQTIATTIGQTYALSFYVGSQGVSNTGPAVVNLRIDGGPNVAYSNAYMGNETLWLLYTTTFTATSSSSTIGFYNGSGTRDNWTGLDNVTLTAVPDPGLPLLMTGLALVAACVSRRRLAARHP
jgi:hypothetical protein